MLDFVFPAHAGVILSAHGNLLQKISFSRTRGSDPGPLDPFSKLAPFFPHTRE